MKEDLQKNMTNHKERLVLISFYRFVKIHEKKKKKVLIEEYLSNKSIKGTILISDEGINGSIAGERTDNIFFEISKEISENSQDAIKD